jgi:hypothetical protein
LLLLKLNEKLFGGKLTEPTPAPVVHETPSKGYPAPHFGHFEVMQQGAPLFGGGLNLCQDMMPQPMQLPLDHLISPSQFEAGLPDHPNDFCFEIEPFFGQFSPI